MPDYDKTIYDPVEVDQDYFAQNPDAWGEFYAKLKTYPEGVIEILFNADTSDILEKICAGFNLNPGQSASLSRLVRAVLVADVYISDMPTEISKRLGVDQNVGREVANQIVLQLFQPALDDIKTLQFQKFGKLPGSSTPQPRQNFAPQNLGGQARPVPGADLPETGGNIIDLRNKF